MPFNLSFARFLGRWIFGNTASSVVLLLFLFMYSFVSVSFFSLSLSLVFAFALLAFVQFSYVFVLFVEYVFEFIVFLCFGSTLQIKWKICYIHSYWDGIVCLKLKCFTDKCTMCCCCWFFYFFLSSMRYGCFFPLG